MIDERGENMISVAPGANATLSSQEIEQYQNVIKSANSLVVQMEIPTETIMTIFKIAEKGNVVKILNPAPLKPLPKKLFSHLDVIIPNEGELSRLHSLLGFENQSYHSELTTDRIVEMSRDIADLGTRYIITTLGPEGCIVFDHKENKAHKIPSFEVEAVDTVGAGDCFNGVLAGQLYKEKDIIDAAITATCASSIAVTRKGAQASMPNRKEIMERVKKYKSLYQTTVLK
jgi:ribokinase